MLSTFKNLLIVLNEMQILGKWTLLGNKNLWLSTCDYVRLSLTFGIDWNWHAIFQRLRLLEQFLQVHGEFTRQTHYFLACGTVFVSSLRLENGEFFTCCYSLTPTSTTTVRHFDSVHRYDSYARCHCDDEYGSRMIEKSQRVSNWMWWNNYSNQLGGINK